MRRNAIDAPAAAATAQPAMIALEWNSGIDRYTVSSGPSPKRSASIRPGNATLSWVTRTALGSPLVPEVKMSMNRSSADRSANVTGVSRYDASSAAQSADSTSMKSTPGGTASGLSASTSWQSALAISRASASPRRVWLSPTGTSPLRPAATSRLEKNVVLPRSAPMCGGFEGSNRARSAAASCAPAVMWSARPADERILW